ncbi:hypothetical protein DFQ03_1820 [Maribacter caenipelagi]|uniref:Uncharacterized protein n=1 Tax=Maribacter caenipelagi TaxID=1447781 RepID=A0A4R7D313_9FLAO|nr:hypothetical protein [Maribacter caenipelagi]TDS15180.1 hypothetical protein DFQ03_1820 [Maribacter caenipelagi]
MKIFTRLAICCTFFCTAMLYSQSKESTVTKPNEEDEGPVMFQFEPNYETAVMLQRAALQEKIRGLDTLDISDRKRHRLIKALYKESRNVNFKKSVLVNTEFEEEEFDD